MNKILKYILLTAGVVICLAYAVYGAYSGISTGKEQVCSNIEVNIQDFNNRQLITNTEIARLLETEGLNPIGKTMKRIKTKSIEDAIEKHPMVRKAECFKTPVGEITVSINSESLYSGLWAMKIITWTISENRCRYRKILRLMFR